MNVKGISFISTYFASNIPRAEFNVVIDAGHSGEDVKLRQYKFLAYKLEFEKVVV